MKSRRDELGKSASRLEFGLILALVVLTLFVYCRVLDFDFINFDDLGYVAHNRQVQGGLTSANIQWAFTTFECANWHPLTWLSLQLDRDLYGGIKPGSYHFTNVALHLANVALLLHVLRRLTGAVWRSALVAGLFALHPLHVESVAWVAERKDVLSTLFWLLTLWAYVAYVERPGWGRYALVLLAFALGLMAKPMLVTLPCVLLLLDWWPLGRWPRGADSPVWQRAAGFNPAAHATRLTRMAAPLWLIVEKLPLLGLVLASCVLTLRAQIQGEALRLFEIFPLEVRLDNALLAYVQYLGKMVWPVDLILFYPHSGTAQLRGQVLAAGALLLTLTLGVLVAGRRRPYLAVGWFWYLGTLVPVIGLVQVGGQALADRYTYVPLIGIFLALVWSCGDLATAVGWRGLKVGLTGTALVVLATCWLRTWEQLDNWRNSWTVWGHVLDVTEAHGVAHDSIGMAYFEDGYWLKARWHLARAVELEPTNANFQNDLGIACLSLGDFQEASRHLSEALRLQPDRADAHHNLAMTQVLLPEKELARALEHSRRAVELNEKLAPGRYLLGYLCHELGHAEEAALHYQEGLRLDPGWPEVGNQLASQLVSRSTLTPAEAAFALLYATEACQATGERRSEYLETQAAALAAAGRSSDAVQALRKALALLSESAAPERYRAVQQRLRTYEQSKP